MTSKARRLPHLPLDFESLSFLAHGTSGALYSIDEDWVLKEHWELEHRALARLGPHPNVIGYFDDTDPKYIILERGETSLSLIQRREASVEKKLAWIGELSEGVRYIHQSDIIHADVRCDNLVIIRSQLKIIDFDGCSIYGSEANAAYKWYNQRDLSVDVQRDIFAYGCTIYQILTGRPTYQELSASKDRSNLVRRLYAEHKSSRMSRVCLSVISCYGAGLVSLSRWKRLLQHFIRLQPGNLALPAS